jgi:ribose transport system substrate-binding protein
MDGRSRLVGRFLVAAIFVTGLAVLVGTAFGSSSAKSARTADPFDAKAALKAAYRGTYSKPPTAPNRAPKGKTVQIVAVGMASPTVAFAANYAVKAARSIGWKVTLYDAKLNPANFPIGVQQGITSKVDAIIGIGLDAGYAATALQQAADAGIKTITVEGWDLDDYKSSAKPVFTEHISFGKRYTSFLGAVRAYGAAQAQWTIGAAGGEGTVLNFTNSQYGTLIFMQQGFKAEAARICPKKCKIVTVPWLAEEFGQKLQAKAQASLLKYPDAKAANGATNPEQGITQAIAKVRPGLPMIGGFGLSIDFDALRAGQVTAVDSWPTEWWAYAAVDTLVSAFNGTKPRDEGLGSAVVDAKHGMPPKGQHWAPRGINVAAAYKKSWGV